MNVKTAVEVIATVMRDHTEANILHSIISSRAQGKLRTNHIYLSNDQIEFLQRHGYHVSFRPDILEYEITLTEESNVE